jgi:hypothetical protein
LEIRRFASTEFLIPPLSTRLQYCWYCDLLLCQNNAAATRSLLFRYFQLLNPSRLKKMYENKIMVLSYFSYYNHDRQILWRKRVSIEGIRYKHWSYSICFWDFNQLKAPITISCLLLCKHPGLKYTEPHFYLLNLMWLFFNLK